MLWARKDDTIGFAIFTSQVRFEMHKSVNELVKCWSAGVKNNIGQELKDMINLAMQMELIEGLQQGGLLPKDLSGGVTEIKGNIKDARMQKYDMGDATPVEK